MQRKWQKDEEIDGMSDSEWNRIIRFLLIAIPYLYNHFAKHMEELPNV